MDRDEIEVEVVYALPLRQDVTRLRVPAGTSAAEAVERSAVSERHPEIAQCVHGLAIYGRLVTPQTVLRDGDRVEVLRALTADPKQVRRLRAGRRRARA